jgi:hypothetical protein
MMAGGVWMLSAALAFAGGEAASPPVASLGPAVVESHPPTAWEVEPLLVTPPLVAGCAAPEAGCGHAHKLLEWLTYSSTQPGLCHCCKQYYPCCQAPLYAYFPCRPGDGCCTVAHDHGGPGLAARAKDWICQRPCWDRIQLFGERIRYKKPVCCDPPAVSDMH